VAFMRAFATAAKGHGGVSVPDGEPRERPSHLKLHHSRADCSQSFVLRPEGKRVVGRKRLHERVMHERRLEPSKVIRLLNIPEPERMTAPPVSVLILQDLQVLRCVPMT
jgi:hypothetical protein